MPEKGGSHKVAQIENAAQVSDAGGAAERFISCLDYKYYRRICALILNPNPLQKPIFRTRLPQAAGLALCIFLGRPGA